MSRKAVGNLLKYLLAFGLLAVVVWVNWKPDSDNGLAQVWRSHAVEGKPVGFGFLGLAFLLIAAGSIITLVRWHHLVRAQGMPFQLRDALRLGLIGIFFNTFLPGSVGGDIVKATFLARGQKRRTVAVATVLMDRVIAVWAMVWMVALLGGYFWWSGMLDSEAAARQLVRGAGVIIAASVVVWGFLGFLPQRRADIFAGRLLKIPKVGHSAAEFWRAVWMYRCRPLSVYLALAMTWLGQVCFVLAFYCSVRTLWDPEMGPIPDVARHFLLVPAGLVIQAVPLFPGGAGIGEAGFGGLYALFGSAAALGVLGSLVFRATTWAFAITGFFVAQRLKVAAAPEPADDSVVVPAEKAEREPSPVS